MESVASQGLWKKLHAAQDTKNADAAFAYKKAVEFANSGKVADAAWWENQGDMAMPEPPTDAKGKQENEHPRLQTR